MICFQNLTDITHEKLENYFLILSTIEKNLVEAKTIQAEIVNVRRQRKRRFKSEFTLYQTLSLFPPRSDVGDDFLESHFKCLYLGSGKEKENRCLVLTFLFRFPRNAKTKKELRRRLLLPYHSSFSLQMWLLLRETKTNPLQW